MSFTIKDSGEREQFAGGMVRDTAAGKIDWWRVYIGPMLERWAVHLTKGNVKYPDVKPGVPNWTLAEGTAEYERFRQSAARHFAQWFNGDRDEDHAAAVYFNICGAEFVRDKLDREPEARVQPVEGRGESQAGWISYDPGCSCTACSTLHRRLGL